MDQGLFLNILFEQTPARLTYALAHTTPFFPMITATLPFSRPSFPAFSAWSRPFFALFFIFILLAGVQASTVVVQGGFGYPVTLAADGTVIDPGFEVSVGTFAEGFDPTAAPSDLPALLAAWRSYGITTTKEIFGVAGSFYFKHLNNDPAFAGKRLYLFFTRTSDHASPAADGANVTDYGVFTRTADALWTFPSVSLDVLPPGDLVQVNTGQIDSALYGAIDPSAVTLAFKAATSNSATAWNEWAASVFGPDPDPALADKTAVVAADGLQNFVHFALDSNPLHASAPPYQVVTVPGVDGAPDSIGITFTRKKSAVSGYVTSAEGSTSLSSWDLPLVETITGSTDTTENVRVTPVTPTDKAFFHIKVAPVDGN
jgi:hypothetical protein